MDHRRVFIAVLWTLLSATLVAAAGDTKGKDADMEATISSEIEYTRMTEKAAGVTDKAQTAGRLAGGNVGGAAVNAGKNKAGDTVDRFSSNEKVKMRKVGGA